MKRRKVFVAVALLIGSVGITMGIAALATGERGASLKGSGEEPFSMVFTMAGKELTIDAPRLSPGDNGGGVVTVLIENSGRAPIAVAEIEIIYWDQYHAEEEVSERVQIKDLDPGGVQTIVWDPPVILYLGSLRVRVTNIE